MKEGRSGPMIAVVVAIPLLLFAAYMGRYYANLERASFMFGVGVDESVGVNDDAGVVKLYPAYRIRNRTFNSLFWPANQLDRLIRPGYWQPSDEEELMGDGGLPEISPE